jgi:hypothetical protein
MGFSRIIALGTHREETSKIGDVRVDAVTKLPYSSYMRKLAECIATIITPRIPWTGGHSVKRNDAALIGNIVLGSDYDLRGEPYPHEFSYVDLRDLLVKLTYLHDHAESLLKWGLENRKEALQRSRANEEEMRKLVGFLISSLT